MAAEKLYELLVLDDAGVSVHMQTDPVAGEIDEHQADMRILRHIAQARHYPVATILGVRDRPLIEHLDEVGGPGAKRGVRVALSVRRADEHHLLTGDERAH